MGHAVEPLADRLVELRLALAEYIRHRGQTAMHLGLGFQQFGKPRLGRCLAPCGLQREFGAKTAGTADGEDREEKAGQQRRPGDADKACGPKAKGLREERRNVGPVHGRGD